jgi:hypothetical protein
VTGLEDFRPGIRKQVRASAKKTETWVRPGRESVGVGRVLAFDQSLGATGFVAIQHVDGVLEVRQALTLRGVAAQDLSSHAKTLAEFLDLEHKLVETLLPYVVSGQSWEVAYEAPPMDTAGMRRSESSLLAAAALISAARAVDLPVLPYVAAQHHRKVIAGRTTFKQPGEITLTPIQAKARYHADLRATAESVGLDMHLVTNEGQRDATAIGLTVLLDRGPR